MNEQTDGHDRNLYASSPLGGGIINKKLSTYITTKQQVIKAFMNVLLFSAMLIWMFTRAVIKYKTYPSSTTVEYYYNTRLPFPAVTFCNLNPLRASKLAEAGGALYDRYRVQFCHFKIRPKLKLILLYVT